MKSASLFLLALVLCSCAMAQEVTPKALSLGQTSRQLVLELQADDIGYSGKVILPKLEKGARFNTGGHIKLDGENYYISCFFEVSTVLSNGIEVKANIDAPYRNQDKQRYEPGSGGNVVYRSPEYKPACGRRG